MQVVVSGFVDVKCENEILVFLNVTGPHGLVRPGLFRISHRLPIKIEGDVCSSTRVSKRSKRKKGFEKIINSSKQNSMKKGP